MPKVGQRIVIGQEGFMGGLDDPEGDDQYKYGFVTNIEQDALPPGLNVDVIKEISRRKGEPAWMLEWRLEAYETWLEMEEPEWCNVGYKPVRFQDIVYYSAPRPATPPACAQDDPNATTPWGEKPSRESDLIPPAIRDTFDQLGVDLSSPLDVTGVAVDAVFDSVSIATTFREELSKDGIIFCSMSQAVRQHGELVQKYLGSVVPHNDNFYAALNSAVFSDGSFVFIPKGVKCPMNLSTYFRINAMKTGQFERTLIVAEEGASVSYLEGCTAPKRDENQLHAAIVEIVALDNADVKYSTVQNWYPGNAEGVGGIYNFVTKRGRAGRNAHISWTQVETGSAVTWKYPSCILEGDNSVGEFYSMSVVNNRQQADTGTKMIHIGQNTRSTIISKSISSGHGQSTYRGLVKMTKGAENARNYSQCDSLLIGNTSGAHTFPYVDVQNMSAQTEHEASCSRLSDDQLFFARQRGISEEDAVAMIVGGFAKDVLAKLPMEFAAEADLLLHAVLEGTVG